ncbi:MAG TPA: tetratricopeptide repeat protein, partial [Armatimonadetes bacterium]|nr:tetratricopeptide repeat protein [Armatimonadota bacterium]
MRFIQLVIAMVLLVTLLAPSADAQLDNQLQRARQLARQGKHDDAIALLRQLVKVQRHLWLAQQLKLEILKLHQQAGRLEKIKAVVERATAQQPSNAENHWLLAQIYLMMGDAWNALRQFICAVGKEPTNGCYYAWLGKAYMDLGADYHALSDFELACRFDPRLESVVAPWRAELLAGRRTAPKAEETTLYTVKVVKPAPTAPSAKRPAKPTSPTQLKGARRPIIKRRFEVDIMPNGAINRIVVNGQICLATLCFRVAQPGWAWPPIFRQVDIPATLVKRERQDGRTIFTGRSTSGNYTVRWREEVTQKPHELIVAYQLTPEVDIPTESVLIEAWIPLGMALGGQWFIVRDGHIEKKPFPEQPPQGPNPVFVTNNNLDTVGWQFRSG